MPRQKKPAKIIPDNLNVAIRTAAMQSLHKGRPVVFNATEIADIAEGIRSLVAERDARKQELAALREFREVVSGMPQTMLPDVVRAAHSRSVQAKP